MGKKMMDREIRWETGFALRRSGTWALEVSIKKGGDEERGHTANKNRTR